MSAEQPNEFRLGNPPEDAISSVKFGPNSSQFLLVSSWDKTVRLYDAVANNLRLTFQHPAPVLDCCFHDSVHSFSGGLDKQLKTFDFNTSQGSVVGQHDAPIKCVLRCPEVNAILTGSWDSTVRLWDPRAQNACKSSHAQPDKVYTMDTCGETLVVGTAGRRVLIWDLRNMGFPQQRRESSLKYQTRCIRCFPNKIGFVQSSVEGRVAVEYMNPEPETQKKKYAFKCHRIKEDSIEKIYPVNAIAFHPHNTFSTGGSDGFVNIWDGFNKKRLCQFHRYPTGITSLCFSDDGSVMAIASSYLYEQGELQNMPDDNLFIRNVTDHETKPK